MDVTLRARLEADLKTAMKGGDQLGRDTIRFVLAALKNAEIDRGGGLSGEEEIALLQRQAKRMQESIEQFQAGNRPELAEREEAQVAIVRRYLPVALSEDEIATLVNDAIGETGASSLKDLGRVMPVALQKAAGRADGKQISAAVRASLGGG